MHLALYLLTTVIPGNRIRFFIENAGSMRTDHFRFMRACLGLRHLQRSDLTWCTSVISPAKRLRIFFQNNTLHESLDAQVYHPPDLAWPEDWSPLVIREGSILRDVYLQPFMRPIEIISDLALRYSWSSYHPSALLWRVSHWHSRDCLAALANLSADNGTPSFQWASFIPPIYLSAWMRLLRCFSTKTSNKEKDEALQDVLPLFHNPSIDLPFRFLTDQEVLQVSGLSQNFTKMAKFKYLLTSRAIRSFVGNSFHPKLASLALGSPEDVQAWVKGLRPSVANIADPTTVRKYYLLLKQEIECVFAKCNYVPISTIAPEPYRQHDFRALVMSPIEMPQVAQPTVGNIPPPYLSKEALRRDTKQSADARLRAIGSPQFLQFIAGLRAVSWHSMQENCGKTLTHVSSLHF